MSVDVRLTRRDFQHLAAAALGGLALGATAAPRPAGAKEVPEGQNPLLVEPHICRGLNTCKELDPEQDNACAGRGDCATVVEHECVSQNNCRGEGGCGAMPGENACKLQGSCAVPLADDVWKKARKRFERLMQEAGKKVGKAPKKKR